MLLVFKEIVQHDKPTLVLGFHHSNQWPISSKYNPSPVSAAGRLSSIQILLTWFYLFGTGLRIKGGKHGFHFKRKKNRSTENWHFHYKEDTVLLLGRYVFLSLPDGNTTGTFSATAPFSGGISEEKQYCIKNLTALENSICLLHNAWCMMSAEICWTIWPLSSLHTFLRTLKEVTLISPQEN